MISYTPKFLKNLIKAGPDFLDIVTKNDLELAIEVNGPIKI